MYFFACLWLFFFFSFLIIPTFLMASGTISFEPFMPPPAFMRSLKKDKYAIWSFLLEVSGQRGQTLFSNTCILLLIIG